MDLWACVSNRTRSKKVSHFLSLARGGSSSSETNRRISSDRTITGETSKKRRRRLKYDDDVVFLGEGNASLEIESVSRASASSSSRAKKVKKGKGKKRKHEPVVVFLGEYDGIESSKVITIDDTNDDDGEERVRLSEKKRRKVEDVVADVREKEKSEECRDGYVFGEKDSNFCNVECGYTSGNPITIGVSSDGSEEEQTLADSVFHTEYDSYLSSSTESKEDEGTSDEDFHVGDASEDSRSRSEDSDGSDDDEKEKVRGKFSKMVKECVRRRKMGSNRINRKKYEKKHRQEEEDEDEEDEEEEEEDEIIGVSVPSRESKILEEEEKREEKTAESVNSDLNVFGDYRENLDCSVPFEDETSKDQKKEQDRGHQRVSLQKETGDSTVIKKREENNNDNANTEDCVNLDAHRVKEHHQDKGAGDSTMVQNGEKDNDADINNSMNLDVHEGEEQQGIGDSTMVKKGEKNNDVCANANDCVNLDVHEGKEHHHGKGTRDSTMITNGEKNNDANAIANDPVNLDVHEGEKHHHANGTRASSMMKNREKNNAANANANDFVNLDVHERKEHHHGKGTGDSTMVKKSDKNNDANAKDSVNLAGHEGKKHHQNKGEGVRNVSSLPKGQEEIGDSAEVINKENKKGKEHKHWFSSNNCEKKVKVEDKESGYIDERHKVHMMPYRTKEQRLIKLLAECFSAKNYSVKDEPNGLEEKDDDDVTQREAQPPERIPFTWTIKKKEPIRIEKSESEKELDRLWDEMDMLLRLGEIDSQVGNIGTNEARENKASLCEHDLYLDEERGLLCRLCLWVATEIKYVTEPFADKYYSEGSAKRVSSGGSRVNTTHFDSVQFKDLDDDKEPVWSQNEGTVWDLIPEIKQSLYPHQQEGFEFIWTRLAGTIDLQTLKRVDPCSEGGCIISHAPGTGKTRLTMVFLQTYLQVFPKCLPIIIAPANLLLTWEDELRKWDIGIPFHNFNTSELSGNEHADASNGIDWSGSTRQNKDAIRMVKLCSWYKDKGILLISYPLYEKLAGGLSEVEVGKGKKNWQMKKKKKRVRPRETVESQIGKILRDYPGLLILDEGHTPRNQRSCIWKVLSESRTQKRILLSGTPFQNNFLELYNILCLMKPSFPDSIPHELKKFCQSRLMQKRRASKELSWEPVSSGNPSDQKINQLKLLMDPFVHVHKGSILEKNLPGLRDCVLILKPEGLQKEILESIESSQNILNFEHKVALVSVHPSLFLECDLTEKEKSGVDKDPLEKVRLDPYEGVKTKFLMEFVRLCDAYNEKALVFSQFIGTLSLIKDQLKSAFNWSVDNEVLYMYGRLSQKEKQSLIHRFNDPNSQAKLLLASIKACSEGINLIGASRVVLLDVVWNPSVERQAICRAYRLGQKKVVYTYHLLAQGTPECTKYCKQAEKDRLSELVFSDRNTADKPKNCAMFEDVVLDHMVQHEKLKDMFSECLVQPKERVLEGFGL